MQKQSFFKTPITVFCSIALLILCAAFITACSKDAVDEETIPYTPTQADLDKAIMINVATDTAFTGNPFKDQHPSIWPLLRDVFTSHPKTLALAKKGNIYIIKAYPNNAGKRGGEILSDIMIKREKGFNPLGFDFEYIRNFYDPSVNYTKHPNGLLPAVGSKFRGDGRKIDGGQPGLLINCITCHIKQDDFIFTN